MALPPGAVTWQAAGIDSAWTTADHLLANAVDALNAANWQRAGGKESDKPDPQPRPTEAKEIQQRLERIRARALAFRDKTTDGEA